MTMHLYAGCSTQLLLNHKLPFLPLLAFLHADRKHHRDEHMALFN